MSIRPLMPFSRGLLRASLILFSSSAQVLFFCAPILGDELKATFLREYPAASLLLEKRYASVSGSGRRLQESFDRTGAVTKTRESDVEFFYSSDSSKMISRNRTVDGKPDKYAEVTSCHTPDHVFLVERREGETSPVLKQFDSVTPENRNQLLGNPATQFRALITAPFSTRSHGPIRPSMEKGDVECLGAELVKFEDRDAVKVIFKLTLTIEHRTKGKVTHSVENYAIFDQAHGWTLLENGLHNSSTQATTRLKYSQAADGELVPVRYEETNPTGRETFQFLDVNFGPISPEVFNLSSTGMVDVEKPAIAQHRSETGWWLYLLAGVTATLAILVGVRARYRRNLSR